MLVVVQSIVDSQAIVKKCFFHVVKPKLACLELHIIFFGVLQFMVINNSHRVIKCSVDKSFKKLIKSCFRNGFFRLACCFKNFIMCLNIAQ